MCRLARNAAEYVVVLAHNTGDASSAAAMAFRAVRGERYGNMAIAHDVAEADLRAMKAALHVWAAAVSSRSVV